MPSKMGRLEDIVREVSNLPPNWHGAGSLHRKVLEEIAALPRAAYSVETGVGRSTLILSHMSSEHVVFALDDSKGSRSLERVRNSPLLNDTVEFVVGSIQTTLPKHAFTKSIDIALMDGAHGYPFPELEYYFLYQHIKTGGFLIIDDIHIPTVTRLFEFVREDEMFDLVRVVRTTAFLKRTGAPTFNAFMDDWWLQNSINEGILICGMPNWASWSILLVCFRCLFNRDSGRLSPRGVARTSSGPGSLSRPDYPIAHLTSLTDRSVR